MTDYFPLQDVKRFDMQKEPVPVKWFLRPLVWLLCFPVFWLHRSKIHRIGVKGVKPPYILLCNHNAFYDFMVATVANFPHQPYYVVAIDGFIGREGIMRWIGCIGKRKFTNDLSLIRNIRKVLDRGKIITLYAEARYSLCGTNAVLPESLGKLVKMCKVPVVTLMTHGHHVDAPFWQGSNPKSKMLRTEADFKLLLTADEVKELSVEEINRRIGEAYVYDDFKWQKENHVRTPQKDRARALHKVLYKCPHCGSEYRMDSHGTILECKACGHKWEMTEYGELQAIEGETYYSHIPDWYEWERACVREEVEAGTYKLDVQCKVNSLPNSKRFITIGDGHLIHDMDGFHLTGTFEGHDWKLEIPAKSLYSVHIEYNYIGEHRDCVDLNTLTDTLYCFPYGEDFAVTKVALATEELYNHWNKK